MLIWTCYITESTEKAVSISAFSVDDVISSVFVGVFFVDVVGVNEEKLKLKKNDDRGILTRGLGLFSELQQELRVPGLFLTKDDASFLS